VDWRVGTGSICVVGTCEDGTSITGMRVVVVGSEVNPVASALVVSVTMAVVVVSGSL
jgi:hypothetical protein